MQGGSNHLRNAGVKLLAEASGVQMPENNPAEDCDDGGVGQLVNVEGVEMAHESRRKTN